MDVRRGYQLIMGSLCGLLVLVGIVNICANTLGGPYMRRRGFTRHLSVRVTPGGPARILVVEVCTVSIRSILTSTPANIGFVISTVRQSRFMFNDYLSVIPSKPPALFGGVIPVFMGMTYWTAGRRTGNINIVEGMRDDTMIRWFNTLAPERSANSLVGQMGGSEIGEYEAGRYTGKHETSRHIGSILRKPWHFIVRNSPRPPDGV